MSSCIFVRYSSRHLIIYFSFTMKFACCHVHLNGQAVPKICLPHFHKSGQGTGQNGCRRIITWYRMAWCAAVHGVAKSRTLLSDWAELNMLHQFSQLRLWSSMGGGLGLLPTQVCVAAEWHWVLETPNLLRGCCKPAHSLLKRGFISQECQQMAPEREVSESLLNHLFSLAFEAFDIQTCLLS